MNILPDRSKTNRVYRSKIERRTIFSSDLAGSKRRLLARGKWSYNGEKQKKGRAIVVPPFLAVIIAQKCTFDSFTQKLGQSNET